MRLRGLVVFIMVFVLIALSGCGYKDLTAFEKDGLWGYKDEDGHVVIEPRYVLAEEFSRYGIAAVADPEQGYIYIDQRGRFVIKPYPIRNDNDFDRFAEGLARFEEKGKIGFFNRRGEIMIPARFEYAEKFQHGFAPVGLHITRKMNGELESIAAEKWGFINKRGDLAIPYRFNRIIQPFNEKGFAEVVESGKRVWIDGEGNIVTP